MRYPKYYKEEVPIAVGMGYFKCVQVLLGNGANASRETETGYTPAIMAAALGHTEILEILLEHGADVDVRVEVYSLPNAPIKYDTAMSLATQMNYPDVLAMLDAHNYQRYLQRLYYMLALLVVVTTAAYSQIGSAGIINLVAQLEETLMLRKKPTRRRR
jgi:hypothetical protein